MQKMKEADLQKTILDYLRLKRYFVWKEHTTGIMKKNGSYIPSGMVGKSDILGLTKQGRFIAIECKIRGNSLSSSQQEFLQHIADNGGLAIVAFGLEDVQKYL